MSVGATATCLRSARRAVASLRAGVRRAHVWRDAAGRLRRFRHLELCRCSSWRQMKILRVDVNHGRDVGEEDAGGEGTGRRVGSRTKKRCGDVGVWRVRPKCFSAYASSAPKYARDGMAPPRNYEVLRPYQQGPWRLAAFARRRPGRPILQQPTAFRAAVSPPKLDLADQGGHRSASPTWSDEIDGCQEPRPS